jgi:hypothetical protein
METIQCQAQIQGNKMKKIIILILLSIWAFAETKAQSNYLLSGTVSDVQIIVQNTSYAGSGYHRGTTVTTSSPQLWYVTPVASLNGNPIQAGNLQIILTNNRNTFTKVSLYDFTGTNLIRTQNIAPNAEIIWGRFNGVGVPYTTGDFPLDASKDYYWKFETVVNQTPILVNDERSMTKNSKVDLYVGFNDVNMPSNSTPVRVKAGQSINEISIVNKGSYFEISSGQTEGTFSFIYEAYSQTFGSPDIIYGQATATVTVSGVNQYCELSILSEKLVLGSTSQHEFTLASPNADINPFNYTVGNLVTGNIDKSGTTLPATSNKEIIDFGNLQTGTFSVVFRSSKANCFASINVSHVNINDACSINISSIDKISGTNNYTANISYSNLNTLKSYVIANGATPLLPQVNISGSSFVINMTTLPQGTYTLNIANEGDKVCNAQKTFNHSFVFINNGATKLETWTKYIHGYKDNWIVSGKNDVASGRDYFGQISFQENATNTVWKSFISDFENEGGSSQAKAIIGFRKDTSRNESTVSVAVTENQIILRERFGKSTDMIIHATIPNVSFPLWVRLTKTGNNIVAEYSKELVQNPVSWLEIGRVNGVFIGYNRYQKYLGVASDKSDVIATARFQGQLGGAVNFSSSTIIASPPVIASNVTSPSSGQSVTLSTSTSCIAPATNKWYKNTDNISFSAGSTVNVQAYNTDSYYARCENGLNKSVKSNVVTFSITNLLSCNNGTQPFSVASAVYASGSISFSFNASNLSNTNWTILNGSTVVKTGTIQPSTNTQTVSNGNLSAGNYIFKLDGISCNGTAQKTFTVDGIVSAPVLSSIPLSPVTGDNVTLTASGCSGNYNFYNSGSSTAYATNTGSSTVQSVIGGTYYYATCIGSNVPSNYVNINARTTEGTGTGQTFFSNVIKAVPVETVNSKYSPHLFPTISIVNSIDPILGKTYPNWAVAWQVEGGNFSANNRKTPDVGIPFMYDQFQGFYGGYGTRCVDYLSFYYPNTYDPTCLKSNGQPFQYTEFTSAIPFEKRASATYGQANVSIWNAYTLQNAYDEGINAGSSAIQLGFGDRVNNKSTVGLANADIETGYELGQDGSNKHLAFLQGMASSSLGYVFSQYSSPMNVTFIDPSNYPTTNVNTSGYPTYKLNPDGTNRGSGSPQTNTVPFSNDWNPSNTLSLTGKTILDYKNALPSAELSSYSDATFKQGETFVYNNSGSTRVANKFYPNPNVNHVIASVIHAGEVNKWFIQNKLDNRKVFLQSKITCDRGSVGLNDYNEYGFNITNSSLAGKQFDREYSFDIGGFTAMTGCEWTVWDRNYAGHNLDGYNGVFGVINVLYQRKTFGSTSKSFVDLKPTAKFLLWESEISYDNGVTYVKEKAQDYLLNSTHIPQRQFITPDGYWGGFLARPENTEATSCILRVSYNGQNYTYTVTADMWETVDYAQRNTALSSLPNVNKDYHYFLIKL